MSSIDTRVVEARFDNNQFLSGVRSTLNSLTKLNQGMQLNGATAGINNIASGVQQLNNRFHVLRIAATTAISTIAHQATIAGEQFLRSFTVGPLLDGLQIYHTKLNSIQTILANTGFTGKKGLAKVNHALAELNKYSNQTIYNFSEMARNVGTFTAAGVKLNTSVAAIKGIANLAAVSGSNSQQASTAMYQLSQALAAGTVKLQDWNSVVNAGMGGKVFQEALKTTARVHGVAIDAIIKKEGSFRNSLQTGWLSSKILTETLNNFTGDMTRAQLKQIGYTNKQIDAIIKLGKTATDAATKVKTFPQLFDVLKETVSTGWAKSFELIIGNLGQAKNLFTNINNIVGGALTNMAKARNKVLKDWADFGGRTAMIKGVSNAFKALGSVLQPIHDAFREIFPRKTGEQLANMTKSFRDLMAQLKIGPETADNLKRTFAGFFAVLDIGWQVIKSGVKFILDLFGALTKGQGSGGFLGATASIGDFFVALDKAIKKGHGLTKFFQGLEHVLQGPINLIRALASAIFGIFTFKAPNSDQITKSFQPLGALGHSIATIWDKVIGILSHVFHAFEPISQAFSKFFSDLSDALANGFGNFNYEDFLHTVQTGLLGGLVLMIKNFVGLFKKGGGLAPQGFLDTLMSPFHELTDTMKQMQTTLRATTLLQIAAAIGILTLSVIGLSKIDKRGLTKALTAMSVMFAQLFGSLIAFEKIGGPQGLIAAATGLILFATAIRILTSSVKALSKLSWNDLAKGLTGVTVLIAGLTLAVIGMNSESAGMIRAGAGLILLAAGVKILASAVKDISSLDWHSLARGLTGVGGLLAALTLFTRLADVNGSGIRQGAGLILLGAAIKILASAVKDFANNSWEDLAKGLVSISGILLAIGVFSNTVGNPLSLLAAGVALVGIAYSMTIMGKAMAKFGRLSWTEIAKGLVSMAGALALIAGALILLPPSTLLSAAAIIVVASSLGMIGKALAKIGGMSWTEIAKGLITLAGALGIIAGAMYLMTGAIGGAAATLIVAASLTVLAPALLAFAHLKWSEIAKGLVTLAGALTIIGVAGLVLTPVIPSLIGLGAAVALLGVGMLAAGAGVLAFAAGLTALSIGAGALVTSVVAIVSALIGLIPTIAKELGLALTALATGLAEAGPAIVKAFSVIILSIIKAIHKDGPKIIETIGDLLVKLLKKMDESVPKMAASALDMMVEILKSIKKRTPDIVDEISGMIIKMLKALRGHIDDMTTAAIDLLVAFLHGVAKKLDDVITAGTDIIIHLIKGIGKNAVRIANAAADTIVDFINGIADAIENHRQDFVDAGKHMAAAIADGMTFGLASKAVGVVKGAIGMGKSALGGLGHALGIHSPSVEFFKMGSWSAIGFANGIAAYAHLAGHAASLMGKKALESMSKEFRQSAKYLNGSMAEDLVGGKDSVVASWQKTHDLLRSAMQGSAQDVDRLTKRIKDLTKTRKDDDKSIAEATKNLADLKAKHSENDDVVKKATEHLDRLVAARDRHSESIKRATKALEQATYENKLTTNAFDEFTGKMDKQKDKLKDLGKQYDEYTDKINKARDALNAAIQTRDDYNKSVQDQFNVTPDIAPDTVLTDYISQLQNQVAGVQAFSIVIQRLRDLGLNDEMYKILLDKGIDALPFVNQILAGGQAAIDQLNTLTSELSVEAKDLGGTASTELYQAGVDAAQGLLNGLKSKRNEIEQLMEDIAESIVRAMKKTLKIKSPSKVFAEIAIFSVKGLVQGFNNSLPMIKNVADVIGDKLISPLKNYVSKANAIIGENIDANPVISPVLDMSNIDKNAAKIQDILTPEAIVANVSYSGASNASSSYKNTKDSLDAVMTATVSNSNITFVQNNNSPKALSSADIYRQTNNQISKAKGALTK